MIDQKYLSKQIKMHMVLQNIDTKMLAARTGLSITSVGNMLNCKRTPNLETFLKILQGLKLSFDELIKEVK